MRTPRWAVLPARLDSRRLPRKVLADLGGITMLEHVWRRVVAAGCFDRVLVATDADEVAAAARSFGGEVALTGPAPSGTHRVAVAVGDRPVAVVDVQADQPLLDPEHLRMLVRRLEDGDPIVTLGAPFEGDPGAPERVKVVVDGDRAVDFSRSAVPIGGPFVEHLGTYAFAPGVLPRCVAAPRAGRTLGEDLEQLAWLDAGWPIGIALVPRATPSVDTPEQLEAVRARIVAARVI